MPRNWKPAPMTPADEAVYSIMKDIPLKPGDMLLLGPQSCKLIAKGTFRGSLPDKLVIEKSKWEIKAKPKRKRASNT